MAKVYVTEHVRPTMYAGNLLPVAAMPPLATQNVAIGAGSVQSSAFNAATKMVAVHADAICSVEFGANPTATANSRRLAANSTEYFEVFPGHKIAVITNT
jgi:hypothetical protein